MFFKHKKIYNKIEYLINLILLKNKIFVPIFITILKKVFIQLIKIIHVNFINFNQNNLFEFINFNYIIDIKILKEIIFHFYYDFFITNFITIFHSTYFLLYPLKLIIFTP